MTEEVFPVVWTNLRHPELSADGSPRTTEVVLREQHWRKILWKHIIGKKKEAKCWDDVLGAANAAALRESPFAGPVRSAIEALGREIEACLSRPLVLLYACMPAVEKSKATRKWMLITPSGGIAIVWPGAENSLRTYHFWGTVSASRSQRKRWRKAMLIAVQENLPLRRLPERRYQNEVKDHDSKESELRFHYQFVSPSTWGFAADTTGSPWMGVPNVSYRSHTAILPGRSSPECSGNACATNREDEDDA